MEQNSPQQESRIDLNLKRAMHIAGIVSAIVLTISAIFVVRPFYRYELLQEKNAKLETDSRRLKKKNDSADEVFRLKKARQDAVIAQQKTVIAQNKRKLMELSAKMRRDATALKLERERNDGILYSRYLNAARQKVRDLRLRQLMTKISTAMSKLSSGWVDPAEVFPLAQPALPIKTIESALKAIDPKPLNIPQSSIMKFREHILTAVNKTAELKQQHCDRQSIFSEYIVKLNKLRLNDVHYNVKADVSPLNREYRRRLHDCQLRNEQFALQFLVLLNPEALK